jgi:hypothetical protein
MSSENLRKEIVLKSRPVKNPNVKFENKGGEVSVILERRKTWWIAVLSKIFFIPRQKTLVLDKIGSGVVELCDGKKRVSDLIDHLVKVYKLSPYEAEVSLLTYMKMLVKRGIIGLKVEDK